MFQNCCVVAMFVSEHSSVHPFWSLDWKQDVAYHTFQNVSAVVDVISRYRLCAPVWILSGLLIKCRYWSSALRSLVYF